MKNGKPCYLCYDHPGMAPGVHLFLFLSFFSLLFFLFFFYFFFFLFFSPIFCILSFCREARRSRAERHVFATLLKVKCLSVCLFVCLYFRTNENKLKMKVDLAKSTATGNWTGYYEISDRCLSICTNYPLKWAFKNKFTMFLTNVMFIPLKCVCSPSGTISRPTGTFYLLSFALCSFFPLKINRKFNWTSKHFKMLQCFTQKERSVTQLPRFCPSTLLVKVNFYLLLFWL